MVKFNFFKNVKKLLGGGGVAQRKTEKFWQIEKKIGDLYELDNFKEKIFKLLNGKCHFLKDFSEKNGIINNFFEKKFYPHFAVLNKFL